MKSPFVITAVVAAAVVLAAVVTLGLLTAFAGQQSGIDKSKSHGCGKPSAALRGVPNPGYDAQLGQFARCRTSQGR